MHTPVLRAAWRPGLYAVAASRHSTSDLGVSPSGPHRNCRPDQGMSHRLRRKKGSSSFTAAPVLFPPHPESDCGGGGARLVSNWVLRPADPCLHPWEEGPCQADGPNTELTRAGPPAPQVHCQQV